MGQDFLRRVVGYNQFFTDKNYANLARDEQLTILPPAGPGEIEGFTVMVNDINEGNLRNSFLRIQTDGVTRYQSTIGQLSGILEGIDYSHPFAGRYIGATYGVYQFGIKISFEVSAEIRLTNSQCNDPSGYWLTMFGHVGR